MSVIHGSIRATSVSFRLVKCPVCGEKFTRTSEHAWKGRVGTNLVDVCSYHCQRACERKYHSRPDGRKSRSKIVSIEKLTARRDACLHMMETMVKEIENLRKAKRRSAWSVLCGGTNMMRAIRNHIVSQYIRSLMMRRCEII